MSKNRTAYDGSAGDMSAETAGLLCRAVTLGVLRKCVLSKPSDTGVLRATAAPVLLGGVTCIRIETFLADGKALHKNISMSSAEELADIFRGYSQINIMTTCGDCEYRRKKDGAVLLGGAALARRLEAGAPDAGRIEPAKNDREKKRLLNGNEQFLTELGISSPEGRIYDKKQAKFRQICRFLEYVQDIEQYLPADGCLRICDLCCGKSYLSFAVYHYFSRIKGREVSMTGVDLKPDVIDFCSATARRLGFDGLEFVCGDVLKYETAVKPSLVVSLHACDVATDYVLRRAAGWRTPVILSTPCCQHELAANIDCPPLAFVTGHPMLKRKLCEALTDAMRLKYLESQGYSAEAAELVDPDDTPKNILLRAVLRRGFNPESEEAARKMKEYREIRSYLLGKKAEQPGKDEL